MRRARFAPALSRARRAVRDFVLGLVGALRHPASSVDLFGAGALSFSLLLLLVAICAALGYLIAGEIRG